MRNAPSRPITVIALSTKNAAQEKTSLRMLWRSRTGATGFGATGGTAGAILDGPDTGAIGGRGGTASAGFAAGGAGHLIGATSGARPTGATGETGGTTLAGGTYGIDGEGSY